MIKNRVLSVIDKTHLVLSTHPSKACSVDVLSVRWLSGAITERALVVTRNRLGPIVTGSDNIRSVLSIYVNSDRIIRNSEEIIVAKFIKITEPAINPKNS